MDSSWSKLETLQVKKGHSKVYFAWAKYYDKSGLVELRLAKYKICVLGQKTEYAKSITYPRKEWWWRR
jgi:hypothetical protein